ncbi:hypothetical protein [Variovorax sp. RCC_210]|uniref:hypothetical protein n=1 Tax=Variovorax sp. RCC_210 TaxID=3239217 RepID=UPI0035269344
MSAAARRRTLTIIAGVPWSPASSRFMAAAQRTWAIWFNRMARLSFEATVVL